MNFTAKCSIREAHLVALHKVGEPALCSFFFTFSSRKIWGKNMSTARTALSSILRKKKTNMAQPEPNISIFILVREVWFLRRLKALFENLLKVKTRILCINIHLVPACRYAVQKTQNEECKYFYHTVEFFFWTQKSMKKRFCDKSSKKNQRWRDFREPKSSKNMKSSKTLHNQILFISQFYQNRKI